MHKNLTIIEKRLLKNDEICDKMTTNIKFWKEMNYKELFLTLLERSAVEQGTVEFS
jgi:hypothetical protein